MYPIDLPSSSLIKIRQENETTYVFDFIRKKYLVLTPEEWVRQHVIHLLINQYKYPKGLFRTEQGHTMNNLQKRTDILVYDTHGGIDLLVECKAHHVRVDEKTITQAMHYNMKLNARTILITNGIDAFCFEKLNDRWTQSGDIPTYKAI